MNVRREVYVKRKDYLLKELNHDLSKLSNKARFITEILQDTIDLRNKSNTDVVQMLAMNDYTKMNDHYDYLIKLPMNSVTQENVSSLLKDKQIKTSLKDTLFSTTIEDMWLSELQTLQSSLARDTVKSIKIKKK
jgi:DNA topoisomerase-2